MPREQLDEGPAPAGFLGELEAHLVERLASLTSATSDGVDAAVVEAQRDLCRLLGMDRSAIWQGANQDPDRLRLTHLCTLDTIPPVPEGITTNDAFPWFTSQLLRDQMVVVPDVRSLPPEAAVDRASLLYFGDQSTLALPFVRGPSGVRGAISFAATTRREAWPDSLLTHCRLVGQVIHSVLARQLAEDATRQERARLEAILDSSAADLIWFVDAERYALVTWNRAYEVYWRKLTGRDVRRGAPPETLFEGNAGRADQWRHLYDRALREAPFTIEHRLDVGDVVMLVDFNLVVQQGKPVGVSVFARDVTAQRRQEQELERVRDQLHHGRKLEAIGRLAGGVAHDFNNLLTVINMVTATVIEDLGGEGDIADELRYVAEAGERAADLTRQLLTFSRQQPTQVQVVDLARVLRDTQVLLRRVLRADIDLVIRIEPDQAPVLADKSQLEQIVVNLAVNARDAMPEGGRLEMVLSTVEVSRTNDGEPPLAASYVELSVSDTGHGIAPEDVSRIFEPFFTTKGVGKGTGLGLATVLGIVKQSGGDVWVESEPQRGARFRVRLPRASVLPAAAESTSPRELAGEGETILVVDDHPHIRDLLARALESYGYQVLVAAGGAEALAVIESGRGAPDLVVTDVVMPNVSGLELAREVRRRYPDIAVLFGSGFSDVPAEEMARLSAGPVLAKPYTKLGVATAVRAALDRWKLRRDRAVAIP